MFRFIHFLLILDHYFFFTNHSRHCSSFLINFFHLYPYHAIYFSFSFYFYFFFPLFMDSFIKYLLIFLLATLFLYSIILYSLIPLSVTHTLLNMLLVYPLISSSVSVMHWNFWSLLTLAMKQ